MLDAVKEEPTVPITEGGSIDGVLQRNLSDFKGWVSKSGASQTLDIPDSYGGVFIPRRILELSEDPSKVRVVMTEKGPGDIGFVIVERRQQALTDPDKFREWYSEWKKSNIRVIPSNQDEAPEGVDYKHIEQSSLIESGVLDFNDFVYCQYFADRESDPFTHVAKSRSYRDREELQGKGIGTSFYDRLNEVLNLLQFRYLSGAIISQHRDFFTKRRTKYDNLPAAIKKDLPDYDKRGDRLSDIYVETLGNQLP